MPLEIVTWMWEIQSLHRPEAILAPFNMKVDSEYWLHYSVPANNGLQTAYIGLATSSDPEGPWDHQGLVLSTYTNSTYNGIDPAAMVDTTSGRRWLYIGSWGDGIRAVELDANTGFWKDSFDTGSVVASRAIDWTDDLQWKGQSSVYFLIGGNEFKAHLLWDWDWENSVRTILHTGINSNGISESPKRVDL